MFRVATGLLLAYIAVIAACGGGAEAPIGSPIVGDIDEGMVVAIREYMATSGLEGDTSFILLDPEECVTVRAPRQLIYFDGAATPILGRSSVHGTVCILQDKSTISDGAAVITLAVDGAPTITWKVELDQNRSGWQVTGVEYTGG